MNENNAGAPSISRPAQNMSWPNGSVTSILLTFVELPGCCSGSSINECEDSGQAIYRILYVCL